MLLPDVNVWVAVTFGSHIHHRAAKAWFDGLSDEVSFFWRLTQQGFLRLATNASVFGINAVTLAEAWRKYDLYLSDPRVSFANEPAGIENQWRMLTQHQSFSPHVWNDAYLAAFAITAKLEFVTFDKAFAHYPNMACTILT